MHVLDSPGLYSFYEGFLVVFGKHQQKWVPEDKVWSAECIISLYFRFENYCKLLLGVAALKSYFGKLGEAWQTLGLGWQLREENRSFQVCYLTHRLPRLLIIVVQKF